MLSLSFKRGSFPPQSQQETLIFPNKRPALKMSTFYINKPGIFLQSIQLVWRCGSVSMCWVVGERQLKQHTPEKICNRMDMMPGLTRWICFSESSKKQRLAGLSSLCHWLFLGQHYRVTGVPDLPHCYYWSSLSLCPLHLHPHKQPLGLPLSLHIVFVSSS